MSAVRPMFIVTVALAALGVLAVAWLVAMMAMMMATGHGTMMGWGRGSDPAAEAPVTGVTDVRIEDYAFQPANLVVDAGTAITWTNDDSVGHTVTSDGDDTLDSELLGEGDRFTYTFTEPGEYAYYCKPHPFMKGLVTVR